MRFVALDLETTGLSPETDTIIEVAAVAFELEQDESGIWKASNIVEHSQLVYPEREMTEEISMITGITDAMLRGKPVWGDVQERVREFIGTGSVIVGHNVLFDVAMLRTHDINLSEYPILDTFELSEILSQDVESLNLGYLAGLYELSAGDKEHRALGDTRLSIGLFIHYLNQAQKLEESKQSILKLARECEKVKNLGLITEILGWQDDFTIPVILTKEGSSPIKNYCENIQQRIDISCHNITKENKQECFIPPTLASLPLGRSSEGEFLRKHIKKGAKTNIGVFGHAQTAYIETLTRELGYTSQIYHAPEEYCSIDELNERVRLGNWKRKESILIIKLLYWLEDTKTGLMKELKLYGEEREEIAFFRMQEGEINPYYTQLQESLTNAEVVIYDMSKHLSVLHAMSGNISQNTILAGGHEPGTIIRDKNYPPTPIIRRIGHQELSHTSNSLVLKDVTLLEEAMRRSISTHISIEHLVKCLGQLGDTEKLIEVVRFIEAMYLKFPVRPTGPDVNPPGGYGETYFLTQADIWNHGCVNLSLVTSSLLETYREWKEKRVIQNRRDELLTHVVDRAIEGLITFHRIRSNLGAIIEIQYNNLSISLIPRTVQEEIRVFLSGYSNTILYGTGLGGKKVQEFLENEAGITGKLYETGSIKENKHIKINPYIQKELAKSGNLGATVILTTSAKHIREIGKSLENTGFKILMQGISGGKGKQLGLFRQNPKNTILIGTIDMWREELELWNHAKHIIIAKLPFDPPTDAYFLARTVGMKNNFALYSEPMLITKINTLLSRIYSSKYSGIIYCEDIRLNETTWGREVLEEIV